MCVCVCVCVCVCIYLLCMYVCLCVYLCRVCIHECVCTFVHVLSLVSSTHMDLSCRESWLVQGHDWGFKKFIRRGQCDDMLTFYYKVSSSHKKKNLCSGFCHTPFLKSCVRAWFDEYVCACACVFKYSLG